MASVPVFVGLDYHQSSIRVSVMDGSGLELANRSCPNDAGALVALVEGVGVVRRAAIESCCGAADLAEELATEHGWSVDLCHPGYVNRMKQTPDKSDRTDARTLADLTRVGYLPRVWLAPRAVRELRHLLRHRQGLVDERRDAKLRIRAVLREQRVPSPRRAWTKRWLGWLAQTQELSVQGRWVVDRLLGQIAFLESEIRATERRLEEATRDDPMVACLLSQPGIGPVTAWTIRAEIGRFDRFATGKQVSRFCGLSPRNASSGERVADAGLIKAGNARLRATLIEAAHRLIRTEPRWRTLALQLRSRGKPASVVAAAVANRWVRWLYHQMIQTRAVA